MNSMTEPHIRRAQERDIPALERLLLQVCRVHHNGRPDLFRAGGQKYTAAQLKELLADPLRPILVAEHATGVVGYAFCEVQQHIGNTCLTDVRTLYLDDLCVDEALRGRHIGSAIYKEVLALARELGCYNLTLNVWALNPGAVAFYQAQGLQVLKTTMETLL